MSLLSHVFSTMQFAPWLLSGGTRVTYTQHKQMSNDLQWQQNSLHPWEHTPDTLYISMVKNICYGYNFMIGKGL